ncbi:hypothetical protein C8R43DRAFT_1002930 [Mycena crocata]|nr:hypothetical protein C8R43DRAFT_1002930 [Mycena crocata]
MHSNVGAAIHDVESPWTKILSTTKDTLARSAGTCDLCGRHAEHITQHHLYPRAATRRAAKKGVPFTAEQKNTVAAMCWPCHCIMHHLIMVDVLASSYNSIDLLKTHSGINAWLCWAQQKSMRDLHSLMIPKAQAKSLPEVSPAVRSVPSVLASIWAQNQGNFPRWEGKNNRTGSRGHALRQQVRSVAGNRVKKPEIEAAMLAKPEYREWHQWVFSQHRRGEIKNTAVESVRSVLASIWAQNQGNFPIWEGKNNYTRGHALRQQ